MSEITETSNTRKNLFIIKSPLQMLNAYEVIDYFKLTNNILVVVENSTSKNTLQMHNLIDQHKWSEIIIIKKEKSKFFKYVKLVNYLRKTPYNFIIVGDLGNITKAIIANVKKRTVYYIDDGTATFKDYNNYIKINKINKYNFKEFRYLFFGLKMIIKDKINIFTFLDLPPSDVKIIKHDFASFKRKYVQHFNTTENIYFLGQPLENYIAEETYINFIHSFIKRYPNKKIIYMAHRSEKEEQKKKIKTLENHLFEFEENEMPIELYFLKHTLLPGTIVSFFSSALSTLEIIYNISNVHYIFIPREASSNLKNYDVILGPYYESIEKNKLLTI